MEARKDPENQLIMTGLVVCVWVTAASLRWHHKDADFYVTMTSARTQALSRLPWKRSGRRLCDGAADKCNNSQNCVAQNMCWLLSTGFVEIESSGYKPTGQKLELLVLATRPGLSGVGQGSGHSVSYV